jgi:integral membrane protein MviN
VGNEGQQSPLPPEQRPPEQQGYYGWQYDQDETEVRKPPTASNKPSRLFLPAQKPQSNAYPNQAGGGAGQPDGPSANVPSSGALPPRMTPQQQQQYQQPIQDMGTTLGFGQSTEFQYFDVPQPSQPMAQLRQERLQQLREERMRRQQRRMRGGDVTTIFPWQKNHDHQVSSPLPGAIVPPISLPGQLPPEREEISPVRTSTQRPANMPEVSVAPPLPAAQLQPAAATAQDTGMIQKVRLRRATSILTIAFVASRILGLLRQSMFSYVFGATPISDAYLQAFIIPDFIYNVISGGALSSAFIPVFTKLMVSDENAKKAWRLASSALNLTVSILTVLAAFAIIFAHQLVPLYNDASAPEMNMIAGLTQIMLLQAVVMGLGVIVTSVLNAEQDFRLPAIGTMLYNVGLIGGLLPGLFMMLLGHPNPGLAIYFVSWGVVLGAVVQVGIQIPGLFKIGMKYTPRAFDWKDSDILQIGRQMLPRIFNSGMVYLSTIVDRSLIQLVVGSVGGGITEYYNAFQLILLPFGIFGQSPATAAFPTLAENVAKNRFDRVRTTILDTLRGILAICIPCSIGLMIIGLTVIQVLFQHGYFTLQMAQDTNVALIFFSLGLSGLAAVEILTRSFYAMRDTRTPVTVSIAQFVFKIALSLILINLAAFGAVYGMAALAFTTSLANIVEASVLFWLLDQRIGKMQTRQLLLFIGRVMLASLAMGVALFIVRYVLDLFLVTTAQQSMGWAGVLLAAIKLVIEIAIGGFVYIRVARMFGIEELGSIERLLGPVRRILNRLNLNWL